MSRWAFPAFAAVMLGLPLLPVPDFWITQSIYIGLYSLVALGLVLLTGVAGLTSFGQAAFVGIGAYAAAYLATRSGLPPLVTLAVGVALAVLAALLLGALTLRMSGHYLPLATICWGLALNYAMANAEGLGKYDGILGIPAMSLFGIDLGTGRGLHPLVWAIALLAAVAVTHLLDSRPGRAIRALKGGATMAEAMGISTFRYKLTAFVIAAVLAAVSGWLFAHFQRSVSPSPFGINKGIEYLFMAVLGGVGHVWGAFLGSAVVRLTEDQLQVLLPKLLGSGGNFETIVFGIVLVVVLKYAPDGLWSFVGRFRALPQRPRDWGGAEPLPRRARPAHGERLLDVEKVRKQFGGLVAVNDVGFSVNAGEIVALIGPNGAGKSTTFNLITGVLPLSGGAVRWRGQEIYGPAVACDRTAGRVAHLPAREDDSRDDGAGKRRSGRLWPHACRGAARHAAPGSQRGEAAVCRRPGAAAARRHGRAHARSGRQPADGPAAADGDRPRTGHRPGAAAAGRTGRRLAPPREAGAGRRAAPAEGRRHEPAAGGARHGFRHGPGRPRGGDGVRHQADRRHARRGAGQPRGARRVSGDGALMTAARPTALLEVADLRAGYGRAEVLTGLNFVLAPQQVVSVIGPNGAGKSTTLAALMGILPYRGRVLFDGQDLAGTTLEDRVMLGLALVPEKRELFATMPVQDNLVLGGYRAMKLRVPNWKNAIEHVYALFPRLKERRAQLAGTLSGGERQMLAVGRALMSAPKC